MTSEIPRARGRAAAWILAGALAGAVGLVAVLRASSVSAPAVISSPSASGSMLGASAAVLEGGSSSGAPRPPEVAREVPPEVTPEATSGVTPEVTRVAGERYRLYVFSFRVEAARFGVVDLEASDGLEGVLARTGASLVVNGGFFDAQRRPEGLVLVEGAELSAFSSSLGGGVLSVLGDRAVLEDAQGWKAPPAGARFSIQGRPRLVVHGEANTRDERAKAERTALCVLGEGQGRGKHLEVVLARGEARGEGPTLLAFAEMLVSRGCEEALNLDGGPSTGAAWRGTGGAESLPIRAPIRQAITVRVGR